MVLAWLAAIAFWWASWKGLVWNLDPSEWFAHVVVFSLLLFGTKFCGCCRKVGKMMGGSMNCACTCGSCEGGRCGNVHDEGHKHV